MANSAVLGPPIDELRVKRNRARRYIFPGVEGEFPSVTTVCNRQAKPALVPWAERTVAEFAVDHRNEWVGLERKEAVKMLRDATSRVRDRSLSLGHAVHEALDQSTEWVDAEIAPYVGAARQALDDLRIEPLLSEVVVYNATYSYAGTCDLVGRSLDDGAAVLVDWKTGKALYDAVALQLTAYARAEWWADHQDGEWVAQPWPEISTAWAILLHADGSYKARRIPVEDRRWRTFVALRTLQVWHDNYARDGWYDHEHAPCTRSATKVT